MSSNIKEFKIDITDGQLEELDQKLRLGRWPERETVDDWSQGVPLNYMQDVVEYWLNGYDWRSRESYLNEMPQFVGTYQGLELHFIHYRSPHHDARPLIMTHGWPGSVVEFRKVIEPLANPTAFGGSSEDAFHVVCPALPGYGFSSKPVETGFGVEKIGAIWNDLMKSLGYEHYFAQGGDWGSAVTTAIGMQNLGNCQKIHVNMPSAPPTKQALENPTERDKLALAGGAYYQQWGAGYSKQQSTRPQTLGYALVDSPIGQAAWILEKFYEWTDCDGHPENVFTKDELLDNVMFYWLTGSGASSGRLYWESFGKAFSGGLKNIDLPTGCSIFPKEIVPTPRSWAEQVYTNIVYWNELDKGGHFAAFEQPELFVEELRACFRPS